MNNKNFIVVLIFCLFSLNTMGQNDSLQTRVGQISFFYPLGTNGAKSGQYTNNLSFNLLSGVNGGLKGVELGGVVNVIRGEVKGAQLSGVANVDLGSSEGVMLSGVTNVCSDSVSGFLASGVCNVVTSNTKGVQLSTVNISSGHIQGLQQGVVNYTQSIKGLQLGVLNMCKSSHGLQLGVVNVADSLKGIPIGVVSVVKKGYFAFEASVSEVLYGNITYKMGVSKFYNLFNIGYSQYKGRPVYALGYGFGSLLDLGERHGLSLEILENQIVYDNIWEGLNSLSRFQIAYQYHLSKRFSVGLGPSFNVYVTDKLVYVDNGTLDLPHTFYKKEIRGNKIFMWLGFKAGLTLRI